MTLKVSTVIWLLLQILEWPSFGRWSAKFRIKNIIKISTYVFPKSKHFSCSHFTLLSRDSCLLCLVKMVSRSTSAFLMVFQILSLNSWPLGVGKSFCAKILYVCTQILMKNGDSPSLSVDRHIGLWLWTRPEQRVRQLNKCACNVALTKREALFEFVKSIWSEPCVMLCCSFCIFTVIPDSHPSLQHLLQHQQKGSEHEMAPTCREEPKARTMQGCRKAVENYKDKLQVIQCWTGLTGRVDVR